MAFTNPRPSSRPPRTLLQVSNPTDRSEADADEESHDSSSECDTDDLSMKQRIICRAGAISPFDAYGLESYPKPKTPSPPPPRYSPSLRGVNGTNQQDAEELDIKYLGILSPPPRVFHNPHPRYHDCYVPDRFSVRDFLEAPGSEEDKVELGSAPYPPPDCGHVGMVRQPTRAMQSTRPLQIHPRKRADSSAMCWDPSSQSMRRSFSSYSIYSQESAPYGASQYRSSLHAQPMRAGVSSAGSGIYAFAPNPVLPSHIYCDESGEYPPSMRTTTSVVQGGAPSLVGSSQYPRPRRRGALSLDMHGLPLIDEQKESTFTPTDSQYPRNGLSNSGWHSHHEPLRPSQNPPTARTGSAVLPHPWLDEKGKHEHPQRTTTISRQPGHHPPMNPKRRFGNRNAKRMPYSSDGKRDWSSDLCMFCDHNLGTCCAAFWCPCIIYSRNKSRIQHLYEQEKVHPRRGDTCSDDCAIHACMSAFCLFGWAIQIPNRAAVRRRYDIEGDCIGDFAAALFCSPCELSQESREIDLEERALRDAARKRGSKGPG